MLKYKIYLLLTLLFFMLSSCATKRADVLQDAFLSPPAVPAGMSLLNPYISALNEPCYSLASLQDSFVTHGAICKRNGAWEVIPSISEPTPIGAMGLKKLEI